MMKSHTLWTQKSLPLRPVQCFVVVQWVSVSYKCVSVYASFARLYAHS